MDVFGVFCFEETVVLLRIVQDDRSASADAL